MKYMWWQMKKNVSNRIVEFLNMNEAFKKVSEQTIYTIAHDIAKFKEYQVDDVIVKQDIKSYYNLAHQEKEEAMMKQLREKDTTFVETMQNVRRENHMKNRKRLEERHAYKKYST